MAFQPGEENAPGKLCSSVPVPKGELKESWRRLFIRACSD